MKIRQSFYKKILIYMLGIFSTMPIICLNIGSTSITFFQFFIVVLTVYFIMNMRAMKNVKLRKWEGIFILWLCWSIGSSLFGTAFFLHEEPDWATTGFAYIPKIGLYVIFIILWINQPNLQEKNAILLKGIYMGCLGNLVWAVLDAAIYYLFKISINNIVFLDYIQRNGIRGGQLSIISATGTMIRATGFNYDPAHIGFIAPMIIGYGMLKKKYSVVLLGVLAIIASASTTSLVTTVLIVFINLNKFDFSIGKKIDKKFIVIVALLLGGFFFAWVNGYVSAFFDVLNSAVNSFSGRVTNTYMNTDRLDLRMVYILYLPNAIVKAGFKLLWGTGLGTASYAYLLDSEVHSIINTYFSNVYFLYDMENTYLSYLFDTGIIGITLFLSCILKLYFYYRKKICNNGDAECVYYAGICVMIFSFCFYHYIIFAPQMLLLMTSLSSMRDGE